MKTAPRDGTEILILTEQGAYAMTFIVGEWEHSYYDPPEREPDGWFAVDHNGTVIDEVVIEVDSWYDPNDETGNTVIFNEYEALAWMPMPANTNDYRSNNVQQSN